MNTTDDLLLGNTISPEFLAALAATGYCRKKGFTTGKLSVLFNTDRDEYQTVLSEITERTTAEEIQAICRAAGTTLKEQQSIVDALWKFFEKSCTPQKLDQ
jgi:hypothetical protein